VSGQDVVDLGGCDGCGLGCAVACATGGVDTAREARRVLVATGLALAVLAGAPALVTGAAWVLAAGLATLLAGLVTAGLGLVALGRGRPAGDGAARLAYRLVPLGVAGLLVTWLGTVGDLLLW
jgi:hypothetical protein